MDNLNLNRIDPRLKQLSYSSRNTLQSCARKFELSKCEVASSHIEDEDSQITLAFGSVLHLGIQLIFAGKSQDEILYQMYRAWELPLNIKSSRHKKSFWLAVIAVQKFIYMRESGFLANLEILYYNGKPAIELSFLVDFNEGFKERGWVDLLLRDTETGKIFCVELKSDSSKQAIPEAKYANSSQPLGYSVILDHIVPDLASYEVIYLIYKTESMEYVVFQFTKNLLAKAEWLTTIMLDIEKIKLYSKFGLFPKNGNACTAWGRVCKYFGICNMSNKTLVQAPTKATSDAIEEDNNKYEIQTSVMELIDSQLSKE